MQTLSINKLPIVLVRPQLISLQKVSHFLFKIILYVYFLAYKTIATERISFHFLNSAIVIF